eukprot:UN10760
MNSPDWLQQLLHRKLLIHLQQWRRQLPQQRQHQLLATRRSKFRCRRNQDHWERGFYPVSGMPESN